MACVFCIRVVLCVLLMLRVSVFGVLFVSYCVCFCMACYCCVAAVFVCISFEVVSAFCL